jgi:Phage portal protein/Phage Mu protein F like protein/High potential iron-sulfur protein
MAEQFDLFGKAPQMMPGASRSPINPNAGMVARPQGPFAQHGGNVSRQTLLARPTTGSRADAAIPARQGPASNQNTLNVGAESATIYEQMAPPQPPNAISDVTIDRNWFSPFQPVTPFGPPWQTYPRAYDYPVGENINFIPGRVEVFTMLRAMAQGWGLLRTVIETRKDQLMRIPWTIRTLDQDRSVQNKQKDKGNKRIQQLREFFKRPDRHHGFQQWARMILEDKFVLDAATITIWRTVGGDPYSLMVTDGATIKPLIDDAGLRPEFPNPAYQQVIKGLPLINLDSTEILYAPQRPRPQMPHYGYSEVEQIMLEICEGLRKQLYKNSFWNEGTLPEMLIGVPEEWKAEQIASFQAWFDSYMEGNIGQRTKARFIPGGMKPYDVKNADGGSLKTDEDEWIARIVCFAFSIAPTPFIRQLNRSTAQSAAQEAEEEGLHPLMTWFKTEVMDPFIQTDLGWGFDDLEFDWEPQPEVDSLKQMQELTGYVKAGIQTVNEARNALDLPDDPAGNELIIETTMGPTPLKEALDASRAQAVAKPDELQRQQDAHDMTMQQGKQQLQSGKQDLKDRQNAPPGKPVKKPAAKMEVGKFSHRPFRRVDAPSILRESAQKAIDHATVRLTDRLHKMARKAGAHVRAHKFAVAKKDDKGNRVDELVASFDLTDFEDLANDLGLADFVGETVIEAMAGIGYGLDDDLSGVVNDRAIEWASQNAADLVADIDESTRNMLRDTISQGLADGLSKDDLAAEIEDSDTFDADRAELIARTEIGNANASASLISYQTAAAETGLKIRKVWLLGPNPCEICQANADQGPIDLDDEFQSGDDAPLAHPNCVCDLSTEVEDEGESNDEGEDTDAEDKIEQIAKGKSSQSAANYIDQSPYAQHCAECTMFRPARNTLLGTCTAVSGSINPGGWCQYFEEKEGG